MSDIDILRKTAQTPFPTRTDAHAGRSRTRAETVNSEPGTGNGSRRSLNSLGGLCAAGLGRGRVLLGLLRLAESAGAGDGVGAQVGAVAALGGRGDDGAELPVLRGRGLSVVCREVAGESED